MNPVKSIKVFALLLIFPFFSYSQTSQPSSENGQQNIQSGKSDSIFENITFLNAANFDFSNELQTNYLGKLNIFAPNIKKTPWGFNAGIMKIKFSYNDTSHSRYYIENRKISPLDSIKHGNKYLREYNKYTTARTNNVWSFYVQPLIRLVTWPKKFKRDDQLASPLPNGIYLHFHGELLVNRINITTTVDNLRRDTAFMDTSSRGTAYFYYPTNKIQDDRTYLNGYFGVGLTFNLDPFGNGNSRFFFQPTIGWTTNYPNWANQEITSSSVSVVPVRGATTPVLQTYETPDNHGFYLVRAEFMQYLSSNSQIIVGADIRGIFPKFNPLYAAYVGLNVNLNALAGIFSDKNKNASNTNDNTTTTNPSNNSNQSSNNQR